MFPEMVKQTIETEVMAEKIKGGWGGTNFVRFWAGDDFQVAHRGV
jgi:hypothetical protein